MTNGELLLDVSDVNANYGDFRALFGAGLRLAKGETVAIIGANGSGKTTLMKTITGLVRAVSGSVRLEGEELAGLPAPEILVRGVAMVPEGRKLFPSLSVEENLLIGAHVRRGNGPWNLDTLYELFPILKERRYNPGTALSGGQQQMVAIGRALMSNPRILLCDEISLGLAPIVIRDIYAAVPRIKESGTAIVVVEQDIGQALRIADRVYCMMEGRMTLEGTPDTLSREDIHNAYFGVSA